MDIPVLYIVYQKWPYIISSRYIFHVGFWGCTWKKPTILSLNGWMFGENPLIFICNMVVIWSEIQLKNHHLVLLGPLFSSMLPLEFRQKKHQIRWMFPPEFFLFVHTCSLTNWTTSQAGYEFLDLEKQKKNEENNLPRKCFFLSQLIWEKKEKAILTRRIEIFFVNFQPVLWGNDAIWLGHIFQIGWGKTTN